MSDSDLALSSTSSRRDRGFFDRPIEDIPLSRLRYIARHEMGHVLGLAGLIQGAPAGTAHWPFQLDVMGAGTDRISPDSIGALMDIGYPAAWYGAE